MKRTTTLPMPTGRLGLHTPAHTPPQHPNSPRHGGPPPTERAAWQPAVLGTPPPIPLVGGPDRPNEPTPTTVPPAGESTAAVDPPAIAVMVGLARLTDLAESGDPRRSNTLRAFAQCRTPGQVAWVMDHVTDSGKKTKADLLQPRVGATPTLMTYLAQPAAKQQMACLCLLAMPRMASDGTRRRFPKMLPLIQQHLPEAWPPELDGFRRTCIQTARDACDTMTPLDDREGGLIQAIRARLVSYAHPEDQGTPSPVSSLPGYQPPPGVAIVVGRRLEALLQETVQPEVGLAATDRSTPRQRLPDPLPIPTLPPLSRPTGVHSGGLPPPRQAKADIGQAITQIRALPSGRERLEFVLKMGSPQWRQAHPALRLLTLPDLVGALDGLGDTQADRALATELALCCLARPSDLSLLQPERLAQEVQTLLRCLPDTWPSTALRKDIEERAARSQRYLQGSTSNETRETLAPLSAWLARQTAPPDLPLRITTPIREDTPPQPPMRIPGTMPPPLNGPLTMEPTPVHHRPTPMSGWGELSRLAGVLLKSPPYVHMALIDPRALIANHLKRCGNLDRFAALVPLVVDNRAWGAVLDDLQAHNAHAAFELATALACVRVLGDAPVPMDLVLALIHHTRGGHPWPEWLPRGLGQAAANTPGAADMLRMRLLDLLSR